MHPILETFEKNLSAHIDDLSAEQILFRPAAETDCWSIQQIVQHLNLTYVATSQVMQTYIAKGTPTKASPTLQQRVGQFTICTLGLFPSGRKAPALVDPGPADSQQPTPSGQQLAQSVADQLIRLDSLAIHAEQVFGKKRRAIRHMILGPLSVHQWRRFLAVHGTHHLKQIARIRLAHRLPQTRKPG